MNGEKKYHKQAGNVFFALFGAVALVGAVGAASMTVLKGPVRTMSEVTKRTVAENDILSAGKLAAVGATQTQAIPDCDSDTKIEPVPFEDAAGGPAPAGGGYMPPSFGASLQDPWQTRYGYCAWDLGSQTLQAGCEVSPGVSNRLAGGDGNNQILYAVISAGPDRVFQTTCQSFTDADTAGNGNGVYDPPDEKMVMKAAGSDDVLKIYTYGDATNAAQGTAGAGLWAEKSGDPTKATTAYNLEVRTADDSDAAFSLDRATGESSFLVLKTDNLAARTIPNGSHDDGFIALSSPLRFDPSPSGVPFSAPLGGGAGGGGGGGGSDTLASLACADQQIAKWNNAAGEWQCAADGGGAGGDTLASLACSDGQVAKWNNGASEWQCAVDATGGGGSSVWLQDGPGGPAEIYYNGGNVGIGTNNPNNNLTISSSANTIVNLINGNNSSVGYINKYDDRFLISSSNAIALGAGGQTNNQLWISPTGNVGIGTADPQVKLHVEGAMMGFHNPAGGTDGFVEMYFDSAASLSSKTLNIHYGGNSGLNNELRFGRYGDDFGNWEANPVRFDMDAPNDSVILRPDGQLLATYGIRFNDGTTQTTAASGGGLKCWKIFPTNTYYAGGWLNIGESYSETTCNPPNCGSCSYYRYDCVADGANNVKYTRTGIGSRSDKCSCLTADAMIAMADGTFKEIYKIEVGDKVKGADGQVNTVLGLDRTLMWVGKDQHLIRINGEKEFMSDNHPVMTTAGWKALSPDKAEREAYDQLQGKVGQLKVGDVIVMADGKELPVTSIDVVPHGTEDVRLYNLHLDGNHSYYANGMLVYGNVPDKAGLYPLSQDHEGEPGPLKPH